MDLPNPARDAEIAAWRKRQKESFDAGISTLTKKEKETFDALMDDLLEQKWLVRGMHNAAIEELEWDKLPLFLKDKWIKTFREPNMDIKILMRMGTRLVSALKPKSSAGFEVTDWEIVDKE